MRIDLEQHGDVAVIVLGGDFDFHDVASAADAIGAFVDEGARRVVFDLKGLDFISSGGIGFLIQTAKRLRPLGGEAVLAAPPASFGWIIETLGIDRLFRVFPDAAAAVAHFREAPAAQGNPPRASL